MDTGPKRVRPDEAPPVGCLRGSVQTPLGTLQICQPFTRSVALPCQFRLDLDTGAPAAAILRRGEGLAAPRWQQWESEGASESAFVAALQKQPTSGIRWNHALIADRLLELQWAMRVLPRGPGACTLVLVTGEDVKASRRAGVELALEHFAAYAELLRAQDGDAEAVQALEAVLILEDAATLERRPDWDPPAPKQVKPLSPAQRRQQRLLIVGIALFIGASVLAGFLGIFD